MIKAIFFDVDGTLLSFRTHRVPDSAVEALQRAREKGVKLFIASGRRKADIDQAHLPDVFDGYVTLNGSRCFLSDGTVVFERFIDREDIETLVAWQQTSQAFPCALVTQEKLHLNFTNENVALLGRQRIWRCPLRTICRSGSRWPAAAFRRCFGSSLHSSRRK